MQIQIPTGCQFLLTNSCTGWYPLRMKYVLVSFCILCFTACSSMTKSGDGVIDRPFSAVDASREIVLAPERSFEIVLPSNPTTGYSWTVTIEDVHVVQNVSHEYVADRSNRVGVGGNTTWSLQTRSAGKTAVTYLYQKSWEKDVAPTRTVVFTIIVR